MNSPEDVDLNEILDRYYAGETVSKLIKEYKLGISSAQFLLLFPLIEYKDIECPYCNIPMFSKVPSKTAVQTGKRLPTVFCQTCSHINITSCHCDNCEIINALELKRKQHLVRQKIASYQYEHRHEIIDISILSLKDVVYIVALARCGLNETGDMIHSLGEHTTNLGPNLTFEVELLDYLYKNKIIDISTLSIESCFSFNDENFLVIDYINTRWQFNLGVEDNENVNLISTIEQIIRDYDDWPLNWMSSSYDLWPDLALNECIKYLEIRLNEHGLELRVGEKTKMVIADILKQYSISQTFNFIWCAVKDAAAYYMRSSVSKRQAANIVIGSCQRRSERAFNEEWDVKSFNRDYRSPESVLVSYYINVVTNLGNDYLLKTPHIEIM